MLSSLSQNTLQSNGTKKSKAASAAASAAATSNNQQENGKANIITKTEPGLKNANVPALVPAGSAQPAVPNQNATTVGGTTTTTTAANTTSRSQWKKDHLRINSV